MMNTAVTVTGYMLAAMAGVCFVKGLTFLSNETGV